YGVADCGVAGRDVLLESGSDVYEPLDLGFGRCRMVVAGLPGGLDYGRSSSLRVASKYPRLAAAHFQARGVSAEVVKLAGSVELAPVLGLADCIVDLVETGRTLEENGLAIVEVITESSARLVVNRASYQLKADALGQLIRSVDKASQRSANGD